MALKRAYRYFPKQGDIVYVSFSGEGKEITGSRPAIIISTDDFYRLTKNIIVCPITRTDTGFPLHIKYQGISVLGFIKCEQLKALDPVARRCSFVEQASNPLIFKVLNLVALFTAPQGTKII